jgi:hypothetical protein
MFGGGTAMLGTGTGILGGGITGADWSDCPGTFRTTIKLAAIRDTGASIFKIFIVFIFFCCECSVLTLQARFIPDHGV